ncbi:MAG: ferritin-like domain-containing protein, partial [Myxococcales bacterium]
MTLIETLSESGPLLRDAVRSGNIRVLASMLGPAFRGLVRQRGRNEDSTPMGLAYRAHFDWRYARSHPEMARLYEAAKSSQWNARTDLDWSLSVDPESAARPLIPDRLLPMAGYPGFERLPPEEKGKQRHAVMAWMLSQFLHGEQGALFAAAQVTEAVPWLDAKLYGSTQVVDEGRHVEIFHTYLTRKLEKLYEIDDNLYVVIDALMTDGRWDLKFLGMQILIEGLALGAFGFLRAATSEPLLKELLTRVIGDEARHVHYGVLALQEFYATGLSEKERREREDWAFEVAYLLR